MPGKKSKPIKRAPLRKATKIKAKKSAVRPKIAKSAEKAAISAAVRKEMTIGEVIEKYPESAQIMLQHGLHCIGCHVALWETVEQGASAHGIDPNKLVSDINKEIAKKI
jgi:hybrid cluster-associated redox disulfide protein